MVLKDNIVAIEIKQFTIQSSEQKIIGANKSFYFILNFLFVFYFYFLNLKSEDECKKNMISEFLDSNRIWPR